MAASKRSALSVDIDGKRSTKGAGKETRLPNLDNDFITTTRVKKGLKQWKFLQTKVSKKEEKVAKGDRSKNLETYTQKRDALVKQIQADLPKLQSIFYGENSHAFDRKDKRRTTTGDMPKENREKPSLRPAESETKQMKSQLEREMKSKDETLSSLKSAKSDIDQLKSDLENERKSKEEDILRLNRRLDESENEKVALKVSHKEEIGFHKEEIRKLEESLRSAESETKQMKSQLEREMKSKDEALSSLKSAKSDINQLKSDLENERKSKEEDILRFNRRLDESENEKVALKVSHKEEIGVHKEEIRKLEESLRSAESGINQMKSQLEQEMKSKDEALSSLRSAKSDINQLKSDLENERKSKEEDILRLNRRLDESEDEKVALTVSHKEEIGVHKEEIRKLQERLTVEKSYEERAKELKRKCDELKTELARSEKKLKEEERENKTVKYRLEDEKRRTEEELKRVEAKKNQLNNQLENERKAKEDALLRLSSMASNKLRDNNPNIADLSDPNRPTKLSEQFSELYDNEWTDAFDELEKLLSDKEEKEIISYLRDFVINIHSVCSELSFSKMKTIEEAFVEPSVPSENTKIPTEILKTIKDGIKSMAPKLLEDARKLVLHRLKETYSQDAAVAECWQHHNIKRYIDKCTEVCWYMSVQDPQLVMDGSKSSDEKFDSNKHREYTKKGPYEEFVVWPVLYLYKGGQMLSKGVAQGTKETIGQQ